MSDEELSVTEWMENARQGDESARQKIWVRYIEKLIRVAKSRMANMQRRVSDEEDIANEAFAAFFRAVEKGNVATEGDRNDLWRLLVKITENKIRDLARYQNCEKRGAGVVRGHSVLNDPDSNSDGFGLVPDPTHDFGDQFNSVLIQLQSLLSQELKQIFLLKIEGYTNKEIGNQLGKSEEAIRRKVALIRSKWNEFSESNTND